MNNTVKIATLLFFFAGILLFVGFQSGYFSGHDKPAVNQKDSNSHSVDNQNTETRDEAAVSDSESKPVETITDSRPVSETRISKKQNLPENNANAAPKQELSPEDIRMYSSKSLIIEVPIDDTSGN